MRSKGQGTQLKDGRWRTYRTVVLPNGMKVTRAFTAKSQAETKAKAKRWIPGVPDPRLGDFLDEWIKTKSLSEATLKSYNLAIDKVKKSDLCHARVSQLNPSMLEEFFSELPGTRLPGMVRTILGTALNYAQRNRIIDWNPAKLSDPPRTKKPPERPILTVDTLAAILKATESDLFRNLFTFLAATGLRPNREALRLTRSDFHYDKGWWVKIHTSKTDKGIREVPISDDLYNVIMSTAGDILVFGISYRYAVTAFHKSCEKAEVPRSHLYALRHLYATRQAFSGTHKLVLAKLLGHSDPRLTEKFYIDIDRAMLREAVVG